MKSVRLAEPKYVMSLSVRRGAQDLGLATLTPKRSSKLMPAGNSGIILFSFMIDYLSGPRWGTEAKAKKTQTQTLQWCGPTT
jgi:hypothetical protein